MKRNMLGFALLIALSVTPTVALAQECADYISGTSASGSGSFWCELTGEDSNYCYYSCECTGNCDQMYKDAGLEPAGTAQ